MSVDIRRGQICASGPTVVCVQRRSSPRHGGSGRVPGTQRSHRSPRIRGHADRALEWLIRAAVGPVKLKPLHNAHFAYHRPADTVLSDNAAGASRAVRHLADHGHRHIAYLGDWLEIATARQRFQGYREVLRRGPAASPAPRGPRPPAADSAAAAVSALFRADDAPAALFTSQNLVTIGALRALQELRLRCRPMSSPTAARRSGHETCRRAVRIGEGIVTFVLHRGDVVDTK
jgi:hypothetical protein